MRDERQIDRDGGAGGPYEGASQKEAQLTKSAGGPLSREEGAYTTCKRRLFNSKRAIKLNSLLFPLGVEGSSLPSPPLSFRLQPSGSERPMRVYCVLAVLFPCALAASPSCLDRSGQAIDWWFIYKLPSGSDYAYVDPASLVPAGPLRATGLSLGTASGPLGATLTQLIAGRTTLARVYWNDDLPPGAVALKANVSTGHSKGVIGGDAGGGFLLQHSWPEFPDPSATAFSLGDASTTYGQHFLCISLGSAALEAAALGVQHADAQVYGSSVPAGLKTAMPEVTALVAGWRRGGVYSATLKSQNGASFVQYAKSGKTGLDIWGQVVQPALRMDAWVETWRRSPQQATYCRSAGTGPGCPSCPDSTSTCLACNGSRAYDSMNAEVMQMVTQSGEPVLWKYTRCVRGRMSVRHMLRCSSQLEALDAFAGLTHSPR